MSEAQAQHYPFQFYSVEQGLSQSVVNDIVQDETGFLWIATDYGLSRFDGRSFESFYTNSGLPSNKITSFLLNEQMGLIAGTDRGLALVREDTMQVLLGTDSLINSPVNDIYIDQQRNIWVATEGQGLWKFDDGNTQQFTRLNSALRSDSVRAMESDVDGLWLATREGLHRMGKNRKDIEYIDLPLTDLRLRALESDGTGTLCVGGRAEVLIIRLEDRQVTERYAENMRSRDLHWSEQSQTLFIATEMGLVEVTDENTRVYDESNGLNNQFVRTLFVDQRGMLWLGTFGRGIAQFQGDHYMQFTSDQESGLPNNVISAIKSGVYPDLWVGTYGGGLAVLNRSDYSISTRPVIDPRVFSMSKGEDENIWVSTRGGITVYEKDTRDMEMLEPRDELPTRKIRNVLHLSSTERIIATDDEGLFIKKNGEFTSIKEEDGLISNQVRALHWGENNWIWVGTQQGLTILNRDFEVVRNITVEDGLVSNGILDITEDDVGTIWLAQYGGYSSVTPSRIQAYPLQEQGEPLVCYAIEWRQGELWLGTNKGVQAVDPTQTELRYRYFTNRMGLVGNEVNRGAMHFDGAGNLWVGTVSGLARIEQPQQMRLSSSPVYIQSVMVFDSEFARPSSVDLNFDQNYVTINFQALDFSDPSLLSYRYRLRPIEEEWQYTSQPQVKYSALDNNSYRFEVQALNTDGVWSTTSAGVSINISAPFYMQIWFLVLVFIILSGLLYLIYNYIRVGRLIDLERMRVRIASDLHDDVGSSLTEIALQSDYVQAISEDEETKEISSQLGEMSRDVVNTMDDIVWSIDARNDTVGDMCDRMQDYGNRLAGRSDMDLSFDFEGVNDDQEMSVEKRQHLYLIFKEIINNAVKYSKASNIEVRLKPQGKTYSLQVHDNGIGLDGSVKKTGHGFRNMKMRAEEIGATLNISSEDGLLIEIKGFTLH